MKRQIPIITPAHNPTLFGPARAMTIVCFAAAALGLACGGANAAPADKLVGRESAVIAGGTVST